MFLPTFRVLQPFPSALLQKKVYLRLLYLSYDKECVKFSTYYFLVFETNLGSIFCTVESKRYHEPIRVRVISEQFLQHRLNGAVT